MNILVVDDSRIMRKIVQNTVTSGGIPAGNFMESANGQDAWELLQTDPVDLVLLDWNMPQLNGLDLVKRLRDSDDFKDLPVIMVTSEAAKYNVIEAVKAGVNDYVVKPVSENKLIEKIKRVMEL